MNYLSALSEKYKRRSIFQKVLISFLVMSLVLTTLTSCTSYVFLHRYMLEVNIEELIDKVNIMAGMISGKDDVNYDTVLQFEDLTDSRILYIDASFVAMRIRDESEPGWGGAANGFEQRRQLSEADRAMAERIILLGDREADQRYVEMLAGQVLFAGAPVRDADGSIIGALLLYRKVNVIRDLVLSMVYIIITSMLTAGLLAMVIAWIMSRHITRPILHLTAESKNLASGRYGKTVSITQNDEIGELAATLNIMSQKLYQTITELRDEKLKLTQIIAGIGEGIIAVDDQGNIVHHNKALLELLGLPFWDIHSSNPRLMQLMQMLTDAVRDGNQQTATWKTADERIIRGVIWPITNPDGINSGAVGLVRDISESERLEQMRRDYVANISHELRTPLTGIRGMVEPLMDGLMETEEERMDCYNIIYQETMRLEKLIGEMLDMSRLQSGKTQIDLEPMDVNGIILGAIRRLKERADTQKVKLIADCKATSGVMGNEDRIMQVLIILLDNALSFTPEGGTITVTSRDEDGHVIVGVSDTGSGIDPKDLPYIWERFYKADKSRMRSTTGTGLGLSIAKLATELMGGSITASSEPGSGATFEFTLKPAEKQE